ncbi:MAG: hypothetical protein KGL39_41870 [Patescibacteria group bacterium]|nr:hypothetical protein [Patescibacteria group bacterium]
MDLYDVHHAGSSVARDFSSPSEALEWVRKCGLDLRPSVEIRARHGSYRSTFAIDLDGRAMASLYLVQAGHAVEVKAIDVEVSQHGGEGWGTDRVAVVADSPEEALALALRFDAGEIQPDNYTDPLTGITVAAIRALA